MEENNKIILTEKEQQNLDIVCDFCNEQQPTEFQNLVDAIKQVCVAKLCKVVGIRSKYNYKSRFFDFFSGIMGQAICDKFNLNVVVAPDKFRFIRYDGINFVKRSVEFLNNPDVEDAFIDVFNLVDDHKNLM
ncbi:MAG: hypothetical protein MJ149_03240 [Clostridia bacterium]|nr:hypothetical protein [Clostridia bacterium]MCQ2564937.1 hypothetical protein [Clostridia bacterium]